MFWDLIRGRIAQRRLTQDEVAKALHISRPSLTRRLNGQIKDRPDELMIDRLADVLRLSEDERQQLRALAGYAALAPEAFDSPSSAPAPPSMAMGRRVAVAAHVPSLPVPPRRWPAVSRRRALIGAAVLVASLLAVVIARPQVRPGGVWVAPQHNQTAEIPFYFAARAYPTNRTDPAIASVEFTLSWDGRPGPWLVACRVIKPTHTDLYECIFDPRAVGVPSGQLRVSFDVYDERGNVNKAPHGVRTIVYERP